MDVHLQLEPSSASCASRPYTYVKEHQVPMTMRMKKKETVKMVPLRRYGGVFLCPLFSSSHLVCRHGDVSSVIAPGERGKC